MRIQLIHHKHFSVCIFPSFWTRHIYYVLWEYQVYSQYYATENSEYTSNLLNIYVLVNIYVTNFYEKISVIVITYRKVEWHMQILLLPAHPTINQ